MELADLCPCNLSHGFTEPATLQSCQHRRPLAWDSRRQHGRPPRLTLAFEFRHELKTRSQNNAEGRKSYQRFSCAMKQEKFIPMHLIYFSMMHSSTDKHAIVSKWPKILLPPQGRRHRGCRGCRDTPTFENWGCQHPHFWAPKSK